MRTFLISLVFMCSLSAWTAESNPPPPTTAKDTSKEKAQTKQTGQKAQIDQDNSKPPSISVVVPPTIGSQQHGGGNARDGNEKPHEDRTLEIVFIGITAIATAVLAWSTILLWRSTKKLWLESQRAGELAREEFNTSHRPRLTIRRVAPVINNGNIDGIRCDVYNIGDGEATLVAISLRLWLPGNKTNLPPVPPYAPEIKVQKKLKMGEREELVCNIPADEVSEVDFQYGFGQAAGRDEKLVVIPPTFHFLGYVDYLDANGNKRQTAFLREFDFQTKRFNPIDHPEYEYQD